MDNIDTVFNAETAAARLRGLHGHLDAMALLRVMIEQQFDGKIMLSSSFGAESALLLSMVARIDSTVPVLFMDTRRLFGETLRYQKQLTELLGLEDVRILRPDDGLLQRLDADDMLFTRDSERCCEIRKLQPLDKQMKLFKTLGFKAWITGRKRFQAATRGAIDTIEAGDGFIKINPLAHWSAEDIRQAYLALNLPPHPLVADGFRSIGCMPCTSAVAPGADDRSGRWAGMNKTECGIHLPRQPIAG